MKKVGADKKVQKVLANGEKFLVKNEKGEPVLKGSNTPSKGEIPRFNYIVHNT